MREIKYKVWDKELEMHHDKLCVIDFDLKKVIVFSQSEDDFPSGWLPLSRFVIREYTGLKDKNGVEIYEGDVMRYKRLFHGGIEEKEIVEYSKYAEWICGMWLLNKINHRAEVIGNIFQNPELLEVAE